MLLESELVGGLVLVEEVVLLRVIQLIFSTTKCVGELLDTNLGARMAFVLAT